MKIRQIAEDPRLKQAIKTLEDICIENNLEGIIKLIGDDGYISCYRRKDKSHARITIKEKGIKL